MESAEAFDLIAHAIDTGHIANGYLIRGDLDGNARDLARRIIGKLFPGLSPENYANHPDIVWLEPEGKSRTIKTDSVRDGLVAPLSTTAYSGGWKVGVVVGVDCMQPAAANAFLKTLEEPTPRTLFLLLTDAPDAVMPTIVSRTQRIDLPFEHDRLAGAEDEDVRRILDGASNAAYDKAVAAHALVRVLSDLEARTEDASGKENVAVVRKAFFRTLELVARDWMVTGKVPRSAAFANIEHIETAYRRTTRSLPLESVLCSLMDRMTLP